jgi:hypothetical protein
MCTIRVPSTDDLAFHDVAFGQQTCHELQSANANRNLQLSMNARRAEPIRLDSAGSTAFLSLQKVIDFFAALRK